ncbi:unnamed protein product [Paramecium sonneborni]|uniref:non-specific serine/threonine protein kinase n=1 Tax=Paramecium sonneborni TaxID=65129 RepID=A0A8S1MGS8_9CILI|nr:unnamed protein product [Paramecium sonneborni]
MSKYNLKYELFRTNSGTLYQMEEEQGQKKTNFYAYNLQPSFQQLCLKKEEQIANGRCLRKYLRQIDYNDQKYILFEFIEGESLERLILNYRGKQESISLEIIKQILIQILDTLFQLHQNNILGRVFSTKNIMTCKGQLLFLDFGFGPKIVNQDLDIIAPPEIIKNFNEVEQSSLKYDMKIDSWLLGAVLYHLVKLSPINSIQIEKKKLKQMLYKDVKEYTNYLTTQMQNLDHIVAFTDRYPKEFCSFIEGLLTYDVNKRLSFAQIYKNQFIKSLNLPKYSDQLKFYEQYDDQLLIKEINTLENRTSELLYTKELRKSQRDDEINQYDNFSRKSYKEQTQTSAWDSQLIPPLELESKQNLLYPQPFKFPSSTSSQDDFQGNDQDNIEKQFPHEIQGQNESKFYQIWQFIRMEQFRFTFLEKTADDFVVELQKKNYQLEYLFAYFLKKMGYLILVELLRKINEDVCPWICNNDQLDIWKEFKRDSQKAILEGNIKKKITQLEIILREMFFKDCKIYLKDDRIEKVVRDQLQADADCFQRQKIDETSVYKCCSDEFLKNGYRQLIQTTSKFVEREMKLGQKPELKYNTLLLKAITCHLINRIFHLNKVSLSFQGIIKNKNKTDLITPNEIYQYICRDNAEQEKLQDVKQIWKVNFQSE